MIADRRSEQGFTLIEMLVAVSLLAMLMGVLFSGLDLASHHLASQSARLDRASRSALVQTVLRAELSDALPLRDPGVGPLGNIAFDGRGDGVTFVGPSPASVTSGGLQKLSIEFGDYNRGQGRLLAFWSLFGSADDGAARRSVLLDQVGRVSFSYFGSLSGEPPDWQQSWENTTKLPSLIRVSVEFADGEVMPEFVVALRLSDGVASQVSAIVRP
jgi:general secretion pathway protein J